MNKALRIFWLSTVFASIFSGSLGNAFAPHFTIGCEIYGRGDHGKVNLLRRFPGELCLFADDGSLVLSEKDQIIRFDKDMKKLWSLPIQAHHQVNWSADRRAILVIGSETIEIGSGSKVERVRSDALYVIDLKGKVQKRFSFFEQRHQFNEKAWRAAMLRRYSSERAWKTAAPGHRPDFLELSRFKGASWELTHANSFYEIEAHDAEPVRKEFRRGNYIVNDISLMMAFVLSSDLKRILWQKSLRKELWNMVHDVQVLPTGRLLLYDNGTPERPISQLVEIDLGTLSDVWTYRRAPPKTFYSPRWGGVQRLVDGRTLFTDITTVPTCIEIDRDGQEVWRWEPGKGKYLQQARVLNLNDFLRYNVGI